MLTDPWVWILVTMTGFGLCAFLPVLIQDDRLLKKINWLILIPVSLILILYAYPVGLQVFAQWALRR